MEIPGFKPDEYRKEVADDLKVIEDHTERKAVWEKKKETAAYKISKKHHLEEIRTDEIRKEVAELYNTFEEEKLSTHNWDITAEIEDFLSEAGKTPEKKLLNELLFEIFGKFAPNVARDGESKFVTYSEDHNAMEHASELMKDELKELIEKRKKIVSQYPRNVNVSGNIDCLQMNYLRCLRLVEKILLKHNVKIAGENGLNPSITLSDKDYASVGVIERMFKDLIKHNATKGE